ncbi:serine/threonine-protein phosphatase 2A activator [Impatiens glandulifera]|uniref:serine/threonine-protein phosphatase 2A activator n=1 Tax=Impatiens glandulifera TaxID=253017 RepID=UPI001FB0CAA1|nr:serine/threonine-protein phosphatase 2A activator [Impatiens glandulifera]
MDHQNPDQISPPDPTLTSESPNHVHRFDVSTGSCVGCGGPTSFPPPPSWSENSPPPAYRPIRSPAINIPPHINTQQAIILAPVPQAQKVLMVSPPYQFQSAIKKIKSPEDIRHFHDSDSGKNFIGFVVALSDSTRGRKISDPCHESSTISSIVSILETLSQLIEEVPPVAQSSRYGNYSYRTWHSRMVDDADKFMLSFLPDDLASATVELVPYFTDSFGNSTRIDYGTGHETNFTAWLYCLARLGLIKEEDYQAVVSRVFSKYLELMRKLQLVYCLEPAGSHGVWGLDDYHFIPFIFGSSQLINHKYMKPKSILNDDILESFSNEYFYVSCIAFTKKMKKGLFAEHSPLLNDITCVPNWNKVNSGMLKMYKAEVLEKVPIMQHFLFGSLIKWD